MKLPGIGLLRALTAGMMLVALTSIAAPAWADVSGPCTASLNGTNVAQNGGPVDVGSNDIVAVTMASAAGEVAHLSVDLHYGPVSWNVYSENTSGQSVSKSVSVEDYARYGVGLYKVTSAATLSSGESCSGSALVNVSGNPLTTVAGAGAVAAVGLGVVGMATGAVLAAGQAQQRPRPSPELDSRAGGEDDVPLGEDEYGPVAVYRHMAVAAGCLLAILPAILLTILAMVTGGGGAGMPPPTEPTRPRVGGAGGGWGVRLSLVGLPSGLLAGVGAVVLLQQYAIVYPSTGIIIVGLVGGLLAGIVIPSLGFTRAIRRARRKRQARQA